MIFLLVCFLCACYFFIPTKDQICRIPALKNKKKAKDRTKSWFHCNWMYQYVFYKRRCNYEQFFNVFQVYFEQSEAEGRAELRIGLAKKKVNKKKRYDDDSTRQPILYLVKLFTFLSKFLPFSPSFNLQKLFLMFSTSTIYPKNLCEGFPTIGTMVPTDEKIFGTNR